MADDRDESRTAAKLEAEIPQLIDDLTAAIEAAAAMQDLVRVTRDRVEHHLACVGEAHVAEGTRMATSMASFVYWGPIEIRVAALARALGLSERDAARVHSFVGDSVTLVSCRRCGDAMGSKPRPNRAARARALSICDACAPIDAGEHDELRRRSHASYVRQRREALTAARAGLARIKALVYVDDEAGTSAYEFDPDELRS